MTNKIHFRVGATELGNDQPFVLIAGPCQIEGREHALRMAGALTEMTDRLGIPFIYKSSFDKANRISGTSPRGVGMEAGLRILEEVKAQFGRPVTTDIHEPRHAAPVAEVVDIIQIPAFLCRQTDLLEAAAKTGAAVNIKKGQFLAPEDMQFAVEKVGGQEGVETWLTERGTTFGYNNLVVDMLGFDVMREVTGGCPLIFDVTHSLQRRAPGDAASGGRRAQVVTLAKAGVAVGIAGLFLEAHPDPDRALCDGPSALPLAQLEPFLAQVKAVDDIVKAQPSLAIR